MSKFIYVFCEQDKELLMSLGYELLKQDIDQNIFIFVNQERKKFLQLTLPHLETNTLTF